MNPKDDQKKTPMDSADAQKKRYADRLVDAWDEPFVDRKSTKKFTSGGVVGRTVANKEAKGDKVPGRLEVGGKIFYETRPYATWIADRYLKLEECHNGESEANRKNPEDAKGATKQRGNQGGQTSVS